MSRELIAAGRSARVFYGARTASDLMLEHAFAPLDVPLVTATEDGSRGYHGRVTDAVEDHLRRHPGSAALYACGPDPMLHAVAGLAARHQLRAEVSLDPWMGCGTGLCLGCVVRLQGPDDPAPRYRCACTEGPVFDASQVVWPNPGGPS